MSITTKISDSEQLKIILSEVYKKGYDGASLQDVMNELKNELPKIMQKEYSF